jgi:monofunctional biosynthetic peptidoglycan transglycosylase
MLIPNNANAQVDLTKKIPNMPISNTMINFTQATELQNWVVVNDTVMGGRSRTQIERIELGEKAQAHMLMYGELSLENNGGFASIRRIYSPMDWHSGRTFSLTVIGDGREYQFRLRTNKTWDGVAYVTNFKTVKGEQQTFSFSTNDFTPRFRGRFVRDAGKINFKDITQIGIMLSDGSPGEFSLMVKEIKQLTTSV